MNDSQIVEAIWQRSEAGLKAAEARYGSLCISLAQNITGSHSDAEECLNDALLALWNSIPPQRPTSLSAFICRITRNLALNRLKAKKSQKRGGGQTDILFSELEGLIPDSADDCPAEEVSKIINRWLEKQNTTTRLLFVGRYFYGEPLKKLSKRLNINEGTAKSLLSRARESLKNELISNGIIL